MDRKLKQPKPVKPLPFPRKAKQSIVETLTAGIHRTSVIQERPYTCIITHSHWNGAPVKIVGFSKVSWPDPFDPAHGIQLAKSKGISACARKIWRSMSDQERDTFLRNLHKVEEAIEVLAQANPEQIFVQVDYADKG